MIDDETMEQFVRSGMETAEEAFWKYGQSPNAVALFNDSGDYTFVDYNDPPNDRRRVTVEAMIHRATVAVMIGETWYRQMSPEEEAARPYESLADDPMAEEEIFAMGVRPNDRRGFRMSKKIRRGDHGRVELEDRMAEWMEFESWLRDVLEGVSSAAGDLVRKAYAEWSAQKASDVVRRAFGEG